MKLNLLPTTEKKSRAGRTAALFAFLIVAGAICGYGFLTFVPKTRLEAAKAAIGTLPQDVANADATAKSADTVIAQAAGVIRNAQLAQALIDHNAVYPKLYDDVKRYIPPYYRLQSISARPDSAEQATVTLTGTLSGYQRYADLMLALMRFKDAKTIARSGYTLNDPIVPGLTESDQTGKMRLPNELPVPDDGLERLAYFQRKAAAVPTGYQNTGGYGSGTNDVARGPLPDASLVTITMAVSRNLQVPLAADTLRAAGGAPAAGATGVPGVPAGLPPSGAGLAGVPGGAGGRGD